MTPQDTRKGTLFPYQAYGRGNRITQQPEAIWPLKPTHSTPSLRAVKEWLYPQLCRFNKESHCSHFRDILAGSYKRYEQINSRGLDVAFVDESIVNGMTFQRICELISTALTELGPKR